MATRSDYVPALGFHWLTPLYDLVVGATTRERRFKQALIRQAGIVPGNRVLDLACGTGTLALWTRQQHPNAEVVGVDGDPAILAIAKRKAERAGVTIQLDQALSHELPYPDGHFDRVLSSLFFHHLHCEMKLETTRELFRVLKPGGELHVADWGPAANIFMRGLFLTVQLFDGYGNTQENVSGRLVEVFESSGFSQIELGESFNTIFGTLVLYKAVRPD